ncbi:MAG: hypothetical protein J0L53_19290 [Spirochaetes bacterium]|nr:hypothetical protein [Spirochaetota bacterium]
MNKYKVIFRACDAVQSLRNPRPFNLDKKTLIKICFLSLVEALKPVDHEIFVMGDKLSDEMLEFFGRFQATVTNGVYGNDESIRMTIRQALRYDDEDWVYFCEDDYLHRPETFRDTDEFITNRAEIMDYEPRRAIFKLFVRDLNKKDLFIHPADYPDRYETHWKRHSFLFLSKYCHWRQISHTTFTFMGQVKSLRKFEKYLFHSAHTAHDGYLSRKLYGRLFFFGRGIAVSPIPGHATHMHEHTMTPLVDWQSLVQKYQAQLS